ncbi:peptidase C39 [Paraburkholderia saeva]|jgi:hypothetical protein|uniref:Peptidase C39 n=1 Tax=Paraburkholderia saeva TaxID=2777537 RepID=A0A9N8X2Y6_9BURK|nr:peptidase C39 [Paraburkholderia saeva]CAG4907137.1 hypothetical protein LMG31841_03636 [Paraburkholderia saeva]CAG4920414.1 hypothetical protein R52603_04854 [Paraburkholderia saeva]CAG4926538.1 hypothetical protein R70241_05484 [Paraburkholderia saeva]
MKLTFTQFGFAMCASTCVFASGAFAAEGTGASPVPDFLSAHDVAPQQLKWQAVDDDVLEHQTGKFAGAPMISGFVLSVLSQWQLPNGAAAIAQGALTVTKNLTNQINAQVNTMTKVIEQNATNAANSGANPNATTSGGQGVSVNGVSQVTQVAGDRNVGVNAASIDFNNNVAQVANLPGGTNSPVSSASNASGTIKAGIAFGSGGVTVALQTPAGIATQTIVPSTAAQVSSIAQLLQIAGNNQQVANQLQLHLQTQQMTPAMQQQIGVLQALQNSRR